ncbi:hypothetical protein M1D72_14220 [Vibrio sp. AK197]
MTACAQTQVTSENAAKAWDERYNECVDFAEANTVPFPTNEWFDSLSFEDKRSVIGYVYNYNQNLCTQDEIAQLKAAIAQDDNKQIAFEYQEVITPLDELAANRMQGINKQEVMKIQHKLQKPFSLRYVLTTLDLYQNN